MYITVIIAQFLPFQLTYRVPQPMRGSIGCGIRVCLPSGTSKVTTAVVSHILTEDESRLFESQMEGKIIKDILSVIDQWPIVTDHQLSLWHWIASYYMCSVGEVMRYFLPSEMIIRGVMESSGVAYKKNNSVKKERFIILNEGSNTIDLKRKQRELLDFFLDIKDNRNRVCYRQLIDGGFKAEHIRKAINDGIFTNDYELVVNGNVAQTGSPQAITVRDNMELPLLVKSDSSDSFLANHCISIRERLERGESVLITVSEEQDVVIPDELANYQITYLTGSSSKMKYKNYCTLLNGEARLVVGSRVAVGLPFKNLSLIIVTDEHSTNYKNDSAPRFVARDVALMLANFTGCDIILESFAPSLESYYNTTIGKYNFVDESTVVDCNITPIDKYSIARRERQVYGNIPQVRYFSKLLLTQIESSTKTLLFHNRRGYNSFLMCKDCGWVLRCRNCNVSMTYHKDKRSLVCHYCGERLEPVVTCGECESKNLQLKGVGSENIEEGIKKYFPLASVLRLDSDLLNTKDNIVEARRKIKNGEANIIVGTAMTIPYTANVNFDLVGVIDADTFLNIDDFRAEERAFRMMSRLSRKASGGGMVIQCSNINRPIISDIVRGDYITMAQRELEVRKKFAYPPYVRTTRIYIKHNSEDEAFNVASELSERIKLEMGVDVSCPNTPFVDKVRGLYIFYITLKFQKNGTAEILKRAVLSILSDKKYKSFNISSDVDY